MEKSPECRTAFFVVQRAVQLFKGVKRIFPFDASLLGEFESLYSLWLKNDIFCVLYVTFFCSVSPSRVRSANGISHCPTLSSEIKKPAFFLLVFIDGEFKKHNKFRIFPSSRPDRPEHFLWEQNTGMEEKNTGIKQLINKYRRKFETAENINYYTYKDFRRAERKYLKIMLKGELSPQAGLEY